MDIESNTAITVDPTVKPRPKPRPKPAKKAVAAPVLVPDAVDDSEIPQHHPKRSRSGSDTVPATTVQPPAKKMKILNATSPVQHGGNEGNSRWKSLHHRSPLPSRTHRVVNPGAPDKKRKKRTPAEMAAAAQQKNKLRLELEKIERDKIRMLAEMEEVEEEEQRDEERMGIKDLADLAESHVDDETDGKEGMVRDNDSDIVMTDGDNNKEVDNTFVEVDSEPELEGLDTVKKVSDSELI
jgi:hypothetical protein